jgi:hypothetical protein
VRYTHGEVPEGVIAGWWGRVTRLLEGQWEGGGKWQEGVRARQMQSSCVWEARGRVDVLL